MSIVAWLVIAVTVLLLLAMLVAGVRKAAAARHAELGPATDDAFGYRSHAEAGRDGEEKS